MAPIILPASVFTANMTCKRSNFYAFAPILLLQPWCIALAGNVLNPTDSDPTRLLEPQGISHLKLKPSRSPSGLLYPQPYQPKIQNQFGQNWHYQGGIELGYLGNDGDERAAEFNNFRDFNDSVLINFFDLSAWQSEDGLFFQGSGGGVGRDDQFYRTTFGQYGKFKFTGSFNQTPTRFSRNSITIFNGIGTNNLTLPSTLQPGINSNDQIKQALEDAYHPELGIDRKQANFGIEYWLKKDVKFFADFTHQHRDGSRPYGGSFFPPFYAGFNSGGVVETVEPIDYFDNDIAAGISYAGTGMQWNLKYNGLFFVNENSQLSFENPFINLQGSNFTIERGRIALTPDNQFHQIQADFAYSLPFRGQLTSTFSWSTMLQNEALLPPTVNSGLTFSGIDLDQWNNLSSLSRKTAEAEIDNLLFKIAAQFNPLDRLMLRTSFRYQDEDNKTSYTALNPLNGQYGYISEDGSYAGAVFQPGSSQLPIHYRSIPFARTTMQWNLKGDYRLTDKNRLGLSYQYEQQDYDHRERDKTGENRYKLSISSRSLSWATLRLSYQFADRDGDVYSFNPYTPFYTSSLPGFQPVLPGGSTPHTLAELRKFDLSDRLQHTLIMQNHFLLGDRMDVSLTAKWLDNNYNAPYGLQSEATGAANLEWNYQVSQDLNVFSFYSFQQRNSQIANIDDIGFSSDPHAGGDTFPLSAAWSENAVDTDHFVGMGLHYVWDQFEIDSHYSYNWSKSLLEYEAGEFLSNLAGSFPAIRFQRHILENSLRWQVKKNISLRFYHRFEDGITEDWHYQNLQPLIGNHLFLNASPQNFSTHIFGAFLQYRL